MFVEHQTLLQQNTRARRLHTREPSVIEIDTDDEVGGGERKQSSESIVEIPVTNENHGRKNNVHDDIWCYCAETNRPSTSRTHPETITLRDSPTHDDDVTIIPSTSTATPLRETTNNEAAAFSRWSRRAAGATRPWHQAANDTSISSTTVRD